MIFSSPPPQFGQVCMSMSNTRLSSRAQLMRPDRNWMPADVWPPSRGPLRVTARLPDRQLQGGEIGAAYVSSGS
jgi:hypothetical protein